MWGRECCWPARPCARSSSELTSYSTSIHPSSCERQPTRLIDQCRRGDAPLAPALLDERRLSRQQVAGLRLPRPDVEVLRPSLDRNVRDRQPLVLTQVLAPGIDEE